MGLVDTRRASNVGVAQRKPVEAFLSVWCNLMVPSKNNVSIIPLTYCSENMIDVEAV